MATDLTTPNPAPVTELSSRVVQLARMIDRLPPGNYEIFIQKHELRAQGFDWDLVSTEKISGGSLSKYVPE